MNNFLNQNGKVLQETLADLNSDAVKATLRGLPYRGYYKWLSRLRHHFHIGRLPVYPKCYMRVDVTYNSY